MRTDVNGMIEEVVGGRRSSKATVEAYLKNGATPFTLGIVSHNSAFNELSALIKLQVDEVLFTNASVYAAKFENQDLNNVKAIYAEIADDVVANMSAIEHMEDKVRDYLEKHPLLLRLGDGSDNGEYPGEGTWAVN